MARCVVVGDPNQSLYRFRGADSNAFNRLREMLANNGKKLTIKELPINYRCDKQIIENARQWVPELQGFSQAEGTVANITFSEAMERVNNKGLDISLPDGVNSQPRNLTNTSFAFLCRINLPLIITAYQLISQGKRVCIIGRSQLAKPLKNIIESLCGTNKKDKNYTNRLSNRLDRNGNIIEEGLIYRLNRYAETQAAKYEEEKYENKLEELRQNIECIEILVTRVDDDTVESVLNELDNLFTDEPTPGTICLSTVHRSKGLEFNVVFILRPELMPHPLAKPNPDGSWSDEQQQEQNAQYVAATRAKNRLYYVENWPFGSVRATKEFDSKPIREQKEIYREDDDAPF